MGKISTQQVTIPAGSALSNGIQLDGQLVGLGVPPITSAALSFQASGDGQTWRDVYTNANAESTIPASTGDKFFSAPPGLTPNAGSPEYLKVRSGIGATPVNQAADRIITLHVLYTD